MASLWLGRSACLCRHSSVLFRKALENRGCPSSTTEGTPLGGSNRRACTAMPWRSLPALRDAGGTCRGRNWKCDPGRGYSPALGPLWVSEDTPSRGEIARSDSSRVESCVPAAGGQTQRTRSALRGNDFRSRCCSARLLCVPLAISPSPSAPEPPFWGLTAKIRNGATATIAVRLFSSVCDE